jgi:hypothetical protein
MKYSKSTWPRRSAQLSDHLRDRRGRRRGDLSQRRPRHPLGSAGDQQDPNLAPYVEANLDIMEAAARKMRGEHSFVMGSVKVGKGLDEAIAFHERQGLFSA